MRFSDFNSQCIQLMFPLTEVHVTLGERTLVCLYNYGIHGMVLWLKIFFSVHTHQTRVEFSLSDIAQLLSGVVQGSGIGPLTFLLYINELIGILERHGITVKVFADDVKMYLRVVNDIGVKQIQLSLIHISEPTRPY